MHRNFTIYGAVILLAFMGATVKGYSWYSLFTSAHHGSATGGSHYYHK